MTDPNALLRRAHAAFVAGDCAAARTDLQALLRGHSHAAAVLHLLALVEKKAGDTAAARLVFNRARAAAPADPEIATNHGNLLAGLGEHTAALAEYDAALRARPDHFEALLGRALALQEAGRLAEAADAARRAAAAQPGSARAWSALGLIERAREDHDAALAALDRALALDPDHARALHGRGWVTLARGDAAAALPYLRRAAERAADPAILLDEAVALHETGAADAAIDRLVELTRTRPDWVDGHRALTRMRWQRGEDAEVTASFRAALALRQRDATLWTTYLAAVMQTEGLPAVLDAATAARRAIGDAPGVALAEAVAASQLDMIDRAERAFASVGTSLGPAAEHALIEHRLRHGEHATAVALAEQRVARDPADQLGWALLDTGWRLTGDPRHAWLADRPNLVAALDLDRAVTDAAADLLRARHVARRHPADQSLRGGTQTNGTLFWLADPAIARLQAAISQAVVRYIAALPAPEPEHPLLGRPRAGFRFSGSWSVRLSGAGFHVAHVHPEGWISSACYVALPDAPGDDPRAGWLKLGEPPETLRTGLPPSGWIEPKPGRLALFPAWLWHGTAPFAAGERLTVAFDVLPD